MSTLEKILMNLEQMNRKMDLLLGKAPLVEQGPLDAFALLDMPDHLRKTAMKVVLLGRCTAQDVSNDTGRARAVESMYLNQLVLMGYIKKERKGRKTFFFVAELREEN